MFEIDLNQIIVMPRLDHPALAELHEYQFYLLVGVI